MKSIDKIYNVDFNLKYTKTKQIIDVNRKGMLSKFARGEFSNKKFKKPSMSDYI